MLCSEKKKVRQYVDDEIASPYSKSMVTVGRNEYLPINCSKPKYRTEILNQELVGYTTQVTGDEHKKNKIIFQIFKPTNFK